MKKLLLAVGVAVLFANTAPAQDAKPPVRIAMIRLVHDHAVGFLPKLYNNKDVVLAGVVEPDKALAARYVNNPRNHLNKGLFYDSLSDLLAHTNIDAVAIFSSAYDHKAIVEEAASHHLDIMMEKPLAVSVEHAKAMQAAAAKYNVNIIVNYETTWYPANQEIEQIVQRGDLGDVRKMVIHDGHNGPKEIGCSQDFLSWLTDPKLNGGGALIDFGCYGADLCTWFMNGARPVSVTCVTQHIKPDIYPKVEDEATVIMAYPKAQAILQASWNWPIDRKDTEVYGRTGYALAPQGGNTLRIRLGKNRPETQRAAAPLSKPYDDPASYLAAIVRKEIKPEGLSSLPVNLIATEILEAARDSAAAGRTIELPTKSPFEP